MKETKLEIPGLENSASGAEALFIRPDDIAEFPGVLFLTDIWGPRPGNIGVAQRLAEKGFAVLVPNVVHRFGPIQPNGLETDDAEENKKRLGLLFAALTPEQMVSDGRAYVEFLSAQKGVIPGKIGVVGYCFTGQMAVRIAADQPDKVAAAASFHGGWLATDNAGSPHLLLPRVKARLYFGHADQDSMMPAEWIARLEAALRDWHGTFQSEVYEGAGHGWTVPGRSVYNELQAERAFEKLVELLDATLK
jgi:carboxymethylenebutenolidase